MKIQIQVLIEIETPTEPSINEVEKKVLEKFQGATIKEVLIRNVTKMEE